jgi:hypothetical protein
MAIEYVDGQYRVKPRRASGWIGAALGFPAAMFLFNFCWGSYLQIKHEREKTVALKIYGIAMRHGDLKRYLSNANIEMLSAIEKDHGAISEVTSWKGYDDLVDTGGHFDLRVRRSNRMETDFLYFYNNRPYIESIWDDTTGFYAPPQ